MADDATSLANRAITVPLALGLIRPSMRAMLPPIDDADDVEDDRARRIVRDQTP